MIIDNEQNNEMLEAILEESGLSQTMQELIRKIYKTQQETIRAMEEFLRHDEWRRRYVDDRLEKLLEKVDPEEAKKQKNDLACEDRASITLRSMPKSTLI